jgi:F-type H+-transporting ATPase subunit alpha
VHASCLVLTFSSAHEDLPDAGQVRAFERNAAAYDPTRQPKMAAVGRVVGVAGNRVRIADLDAAMSDVIAMEGARGMVVALEREQTVADVLSGAPRVGDEVRSLGPLAVPAGEAWRGRTVDPLGRPRDGVDGPSRRRAGGASCVAQRGSPHRRPFPTGVKALDFLHPMRAGDRVLVAGPRGSGRTDILVTCMFAQTIPCFFASLTGPPCEPPAHATLVVAERSDPPALRALAPAMAMYMAEHVRDEGGDALVLVDDMCGYQEALRERCEATESEVFSAQAAILDRSGVFRRGSIGVIAADEAPLRASPLTAEFLVDQVVLLDGGARRPSIVPPRIVSKLVPPSALRGLASAAAGRIRVWLSQYIDADAHRIGRTRSALDDETAAVLRRGERVARFLEQPSRTPVSARDLVVLVQAHGTSIPDELDVSDLDAFESLLLAEDFAIDPTQPLRSAEVERIDRAARQIVARLRARRPGANTP